MLFTPKLEYSGLGYRTTDMNKAAGMIYLKNKEYRQKKWGKSLILRLLPHEGWIIGLISNWFMAVVPKTAAGLCILYY